MGVRLRARDTGSTPACPSPRSSETSFPAATSPNFAGGPLPPYNPAVVERSAHTALPRGTPSLTHPPQQQEAQPTHAVAVPALVRRSQLRTRPSEAPGQVSETRFRFARVRFLVQVWGSQVPWQPTQLCARPRRPPSPTPHAAIEGPSFPNHFRVFEMTQCRLCSRRVRHTRSAQHGFTVCILQPLPPRNSGQTCQPNRNKPKTASAGAGD